MTLNDTQRYFVEEFAEDYLAGRMNRRDLLRRVFLITGSAAAAATTLVALGCGSNAPQAKPASGGPPASQATSSAPAAAASPIVTTATLGAATMPPAAQTNDLVVQAGDSAIRAESVQFTGQAGTIFGYLARPKSGPAVPGIIVIPDNTGLTEPHLDIARRYAKEGFAALAVDLVSRDGGSAKYASDPAQIPAILGRMGPEPLLADLQSGLTYLKSADGVRKDRLGVTGFCLGGGQTWALAIGSPDIRAAVPFYGPFSTGTGGAGPTLENLPKSQAAFLAFYGEADRVTSQAPDVEKTLKAAGRPYQIQIEPGGMHGFFKNSAQSYNAAGARDAWPRALAWFTKYLKA